MRTEKGFVWSDGSPCQESDGCQGLFWSSRSPGHPQSPHVGTTTRAVLKSAIIMWSKPVWLVRWRLGLLSLVRGHLSLSDLPLGPAEPKLFCAIW